MRQARVSAGLTMREVVQLSREIGRERKNRRYCMSLSVISGIEREGRVPSIYGLAALAEIYRQPISRLLSYYGIDGSVNSHDTW